MREIRPWFYIDRKLLADSNKKKHMYHKIFCKKVRITLGYIKIKAYFCALLEYYETTKNKQKHHKPAERRA